VVIGDRIRRLRLRQGLRIKDVAMRLPKPDAVGYSMQHVSRIERGWAVAPLHVYLSIAEVLGAEPGRLLGQDAALADLSESEATLIRALRLMQLSPEEALAQLIRPALPG
jgi:transcriptional regulator with XRE-family HTH domain